MGGQDGWGFRMGGGGNLRGYGRIGREKFFDEVELPLARDHRSDVDNRLMLIISTSKIVWHVQENQH